MHPRDASARRIRATHPRDASERRIRATHPRDASARRIRATHPRDASATHRRNPPTKHIPIALSLFLSSSRTRPFECVLIARPAGRRAWHHSVPVCLGTSAPPLSGSARRAAIAASLLCSLLLLIFFAFAFAFAPFELSARDCEVLPKAGAATPTSTDISVCQSRAPAHTKCPYISPCSLVCLEHR